MKNLAQFEQWLWQGNLYTERKSASWFAKAFFRVLFIVIRGFGKHDLDLRASALTYTVVLSLVPVLAMGTALLKGLGADNYMKAAAYKMIAQLEDISGEHAQRIQDLNATMADNESAASKINGSALHLKLAIDKIFDYVDRTNFATLGWIGIVGAFFTIVSLMMHIEAALNNIWEASKARRIGRMVIDYIGLIILLPLSVNLAFWAITAAQSETLFSRITSILRVPWLLPLLFKFLPVLLIVGTFTILYRFMPNTNVKMFPALVGGIIGGMCWILVQTLYIKLQIGVARYNAIYGSFATLPLFIFWLYVGWLVFLMGAETSFAVQKFRRYIPLKGPVSPLTRLALAVDILELAYKNFDSGRPVIAEDFSDQLGYPLREVVRVIRSLERKGLLIPTEDGEHFLPGISQTKLKKSEIFKAICGSEERHESYGQLLASSLADDASKLLDDQGHKKRDVTSERPSLKKS
ncbi:MAG: YihY/virulence factor BrkB family protein [Thermodesulfatator sp.]|nr:MAG: YihY/virulence factor BrkB family protein [Thermodesulfatator sp.]